MPVMDSVYLIGLRVHVLPSPAKQSSVAVGATLHDIRRKFTKHANLRTAFNHTQERNKMAPAQPELKKVRDFQGLASSLNCRRPDRLREKGHCKRRVS